MTVTGLLMAIGLAAPAGLNAYLPLLIVGLMARFTGRLPLAPPLDVLTNGWILLLLGVLVGVEVFLDKIPRIDTINDLIATLFRLGAGVLLGVAGAAAGGLDPWLGAVLGLLAAGALHALKTLARPALTAVAGGLATPGLSMIEDIAVAAGVILSVLAPPVGFLIALLLIAGEGALAAWAWGRARRRGLVIAWPFGLGPRRV